MTTSGLWKNLPDTSAAIVANKNKLVDLAENGLPVTSSNATHLVDFFDAFNADNENNFPIAYTVPRCGWYNFDGTDFFVDPRRDCVMTDENKSTYELAKKSPVARIMIAAAIASILFKILGERNLIDDKQVADSRIKEQLDTLVYSLF